MSIIEKAQLPSQACTSKLMLQPRRWYGWQALGATEELGPPFDATPIFVNEVVPLKTGQGYLELDLILAIGSPRAIRRRFSARIRYQTADAIIADCEGALVAITPISLPWMRRHCPRLVERFASVVTYAFSDWENPDPQEYLNRFLGSSPEAIFAGATEDSFRVKAAPFPAASGVVPFARRYSGMDAWLFLRSVVPFDQDHRWFIYVVPDSLGGLLRICRSWTGIPFWEVRFEVEGGEVVTHSARVNLDRRQRGFGTPEEEMQHLQACISTMLLGAPSDWPVLDYGDEAIARAVQEWAALGHRCHTDVRAMNSA